MERLPRSIEQIVEDQARRWAVLSKQTPPGAPRRPVIAVSRQHGARGGEVARRLACEMGLDLFDREIIQRIAQSAHLSDRLVSALDEKERKLVTDWLAAFASPDYMSPSTYREHLTRVIGALAVHGGAVILGRGAHLVLGPSRALRVLVVAPLADRVAEIACRDQLSHHDARRRVAEIEAERRSFLNQHFRPDFEDLSLFDMVVNTGILGVDGAVSALRAAAAALPMGEVAVTQ
jgi:cytidylate kinase